MNGIVSFKLNDRQAAFVSAFVEHGDKIAAADAAGYDGNHLDTTAHRLLAMPAVAAAIQLQTMHRLRNAAPMALSVIINLARSDKASDRVKLEAAKTLLDRAGFIAPKAADADPDGNKPLSEMTPDELRDFISKGREQLEAKMVDVTPKVDNAAVDAALDAQVIDMFS